MTRLKRTIAAGACLAAMALMGTCSSGGSSSKASDAPSTSTHTVEEIDVSFELPSDWDDLDQDMLIDASANGPLMDELTDRMGLTTEQLQQMASSNLVLFAAAPHAEDGLLSNLNVMVFDEALPKAGALELQYRGIGATDMTSEDVSTDAGDGSRLTYTLEIKDVTMYAEVIALDVDGKAVLITMSGHDAGELADLADDVADSLAPAA